MGEQVFKCKQCGVEVVYVYHPVDVFKGIRSPNSGTAQFGEKKATVFMTCRNGHTFPYEVLK